MQFRKSSFRKVRKPVRAFILSALFLLAAALTGFVTDSRAQQPDSELSTRQPLRSTPDLAPPLPGFHGASLP